MDLGLDLWLWKFLLYVGNESFLLSGVGFAYPFAFVLATI